MAIRHKLVVGGISRGQITDALAAMGVSINDHARRYFDHPVFEIPAPHEVKVVVLTVAELGLPAGGTSADVLVRAQAGGYELCHPSTALFLRLALHDQGSSSNSVLTGTHDAPQGSITVMSPLLEADLAFPRGIYLRNVDGQLWLRGYVCDEQYVWPPDAQLVFSAPEATA